MTKLSEVLPGQIWESTIGGKYEVLAVGLNTLILAAAVRGPGNSALIYGEGSSMSLQHGLNLLHRLVRPRVTKYVVMYRYDGDSRIFPSLSFYDTLEDAQNYSRQQGLRAVAIAPVEFAEGDNLPQ